MQKLLTTIYYWLPLLLNAVIILLSAITVSAETETSTSLQIKGDIANETAFRMSEPNEFTKIKNIFRLKATCDISPDFKLKLATRAWYDAIFDMENNYPKNVEENQEIEFALREAFSDISTGNLDLRIGLQQIVWGEAPGVFITDIVNPKDFREFLLQESKEMRIPVWAIDGMYCLGDAILEWLWIPFVRLDELPERDSEFEFFRSPPPTGSRVVVKGTEEPSRKLKNSEAGGRLLYFINGWDLSVLYLYAFDNSPVFFREIFFDPVTFQHVITYTPRGIRVHIAGATFTKSWKRVVLKGETTYTINKFFWAQNLSDSDGVVKRGVIDYLIGVDYAFSELDLYAGLTGRFISGSQKEIKTDKVSTSFFLKGKTECDFFRINLIVATYFIIEFNNGDYRFSPEVIYEVRDDLDIALGVDIFAGDNDTLYGQFHNKDRIWTMVRYRF